ncbi:hypothetical protein H6P81_008920 [Aristolochia fimbriata]|uniref:Uncharacterized protein n=1 Tax=Aristolochia fimbriata TaxID=158543 RepID=A0AAV7EJD6_ARIFI|nr:hypothetical protein H6P81_008920 [Aristolochia fimbriata]
MGPKGRVDRRPVDGGKSCHSNKFRAFANSDAHFGPQMQAAMSSVAAGLQRKRGREENGGNDHSQMPKKVACEREKESGIGRDEIEQQYQKTDLYAVPGPEIPSELYLGWDAIADLPFSPTLEDDILLGWFPFVEDDFVGLCSQTEVVWDDDLWQIKHINEIPPH